MESKVHLNIINIAIMTPEENEWEINSLKSRYAHLTLSSEQAQLIYKFEEEKRNYNEKLYFSIWEEWDYEHYLFKRILNKEQFIIYEENIQISKDRYCRDLIEQDARHLRDIEYNKEVIKYYEEQFLPDIYKDPLHYVILRASGESQKIDFLKAEYQKYLSNSKRKLLLEHFRHNRIYKPNELEAALLRHKLSSLWPDYTSFKYHMDEPTKVVAEYLKQKLADMQVKCDELIVKKVESMKRFNQKMHKKYFEERREGWHITIAPPSEDQIKEIRMMSLLLLDKRQYNG